jgi:hydroxymethylbilane synthase
VTTLRIATRGSAQAQTQAKVVAAQLRAAHAGLEVELVLVETTGDRRQDVPLHVIGGQGVFVKEVQQAVLDGRADLAVHSAKDLPSTPTAGLVIGALTERRDPRDALIGCKLNDLPAGGAVATGSVRRRAQLSVLRSDLTFVELRGNIHTRLNKVPVGGAIVMAAAALEVLGILDDVAEATPVELMAVDAMVPQVGQGAVAVECAERATATRDLLAAIEHGPTRQAVDCERAFLAELGSGCSLPVGARRRRRRGSEFVLRTFWPAPRASTRRHEGTADEARGRPGGRGVRPPAVGGVTAAGRSGGWAVGQLGGRGRHRPAAERAGRLRACWRPRAAVVECRPSPSSHPPTATARCGRRSGTYGTGWS